MSALDLHSWALISDHVFELTWPGVAVTVVVAVASDERMGEPCVAYWTTGSWLRSERHSRLVGGRRPHPHREGAGQAEVECQDSLRNSSQYRPTGNPSGPSAFGQRKPQFFSHPRILFHGFVRPERRLCVGRGYAAESPDCVPPHKRVGIRQCSDERWHSFGRPPVT